VGKKDALFFPMVLPSQRFTFKFKKPFRFGAGDVMVVDLVAETVTCFRGTRGRKRAR